tara:strand:+ start:113 stop:244 length:132 start_codon:yes stop_codon:yes gene_type:complete
MAQRQTPRSKKGMFARKLKAQMEEELKKYNKEVDRIIVDIGDD